MHNHVNIYCDESSHLIKSDDRFMALGSIWTTTSQSGKLTEDIEQILKSTKEIKFAGPKFSLDQYKQLIHLFSATKSLFFRVIVVDKYNLNHEYYGTDHDKEFIYMMYYQLFKPWMHELKKCPFNIYIDKKDERVQKDSVILQNILSSEFSINDFDFKDSKNSRLIQLSDFFTGAVARKFNRYQPHSDKKKDKIIDTILASKITDFECSSSSKQKNKFNIFCFKG